MMSEKARREKDENARIRRLRDVDRSVLPADGGPRYNRLIFSTSPYLLQHAENPIDWYPWGEEAFDRARREDKPLFLSIGYASCHWCHVMAHESFEDPDVAEVINRHYVSIKVDREERPDIDDQYMTAAHLMNTPGGWPLNIVMDTDKRPFFAATYLPRHPRHGMKGIIDIMRGIAEIWTTKRAAVNQHGGALIAALARVSSMEPADMPERDILAVAYRQLRETYDSERGGFGGAPKFPMPVYLTFLLRFAERAGEPKGRKMVENTLRMMRRGGIYDQIGYGFHRYSTDNRWLVPHFEKMLYDQALMALVYLEAFQATADPCFRDVAKEIFCFVERELTGPDGEWYCALDADSEGKEGTYYLWSASEVESVLGHQEAGVACPFFGITGSGNFEGLNVLSMPSALSEFATREGIGEKGLASRFLRWSHQLLRVRESRVRPLRDEKVLTSWNGLMLAAVARGFAVTREDHWYQAAARAITFIKTHMVDEGGRLMRTRRGNGSGIPAFLDDYAFFSWGLIELYQATMEPSLLEDALHYTREMVHLFKDSEGEGLCESGSDAEIVLVRNKGGTDGVIPSGTSVAAMNLLRLGRITSDAGLTDEGEAVITSVMGKVARQPTGYLTLLEAFDYLTGPVVEITLVCDRESPGTGDMLRAAGRSFIPGLVLRHRREQGEYRIVDGHTTAYVCAAQTCLPPVANAEDLQEILDKQARA